MANLTKHIIGTLSSMIIVYLITIFVQANTNILGMEFHVRMLMLFSWIMISLSISIAIGVED